MQLFENNVTVYINQSILSTDTKVLFDDVSKLPVLGLSDFFLITFFVNNAGVESNWEIVKVTNVTGNECTIVRGFDGTVAREWPVGTVGQMRISRSAMSSIATDSKNALGNSNAAIATANNALSEVLIRVKTGDLASNTGSALVKGTWFGGVFAYISDLATSIGSSLIGFIQGGPGAVPRSAQSKMRDEVSVIDFGAVGDGVADDTVKLQAAIDSGHKHIIVNSGKTFRFTALTISGNDITLYLESGAVLAPQTPTARGITVAGARCAIIGPGMIKGVATFDGLNVRPTYALVWITGNDFLAQGITIDTIPKEGLMFEDSTGHRIEGCRFVGRYPYASYDENTTTNHCAIMSNIPPSAVNSKPALVISGNYFESCIQGCLMANYGDAGNNTGVSITGNTFKDCWDHGVYMSRGKGHNISANLFLSCRRPIVCDGIGSVVVGNTLYSDEVAGIKNAEQILSVREASRCVVSNNAIFGIDASILVQNLETNDCVGNIVANNNIYSTGYAYVTAGVSIGNGAQVCTDNTIIGNTVQSSALGAVNSLIEVNIQSGFFGANNVVNNNMLIRGDVGHGITVNRNTYSEIMGNTLKFLGAAGGATAASAIRMFSSSYPIIKGNRTVYTSGGSNVTMTGISVDAFCSLPKIYDNTFMVTASLAGFVPLALGVASDVRRTLIDPVAGMSGGFTWPSGVSSYAVANTNITTGSKIIVMPINVGAGAVCRDLGYYITSSAGLFTISTAGGATTASASNWTYEII